MPDWLEPCFRASRLVQTFCSGAATYIRATRDRLYQEYGNLSEARKPQPICFWMDTLCIPVDPEHNSLRLEAINKMALTYAAAERCLVLDPELERTSMKTLTSLQMNAHVMASAWLTRSWTFQEARLSRAWFAQFADGLYDPNSRANGALHQRLHTEWLAYQSDSHYLASEMISWYHDMPAVRHTDLTVNQCRYLLSDSTYTFVTVWNQLASRSTSKMEDVHGILANTLDLGATEVLGLPSEEKMKAILRAQEKLPVALIYNDSTKIMDRKCRWVPLYPEITRLSQLYGTLEPSQDGFFLDTVEANPVGFLVDPSIPRGQRIRLVHPSVPTPLWLTFHPEPNGPIPSWKAPGDALAVCYVIGHLEKSSREPSLVRRFGGARFALRKREGKTLHLVYEYSFCYSHYRKLDRDDDYLEIHAERTSPDVVFHVDSGRLLTWPDSREPLNDDAYI